MLTAEKIAEIAIRCSAAFRESRPGRVLIDVKKLAAYTIFVTVHMLDDSWSTSSLEVAPDQSAESLESEATCFFRYLEEQLRSSE